MSVGCHASHGRLRPGEACGDNRRVRRHGRVGPGDCSPRPLTEPDLWVTHPALQVGVSFHVQQELCVRDRWGRLARSGGRLVRFLDVRCMQQPSLRLGYVRGLGGAAPLRAVGKHERQLASSGTSQPATPFAPPALPGFITTMGWSDFSTGFGRTSLPPHSLPFPDGPVEISWGKDEQCPAAPAPTTVPATFGDRASCSRAHLPCLGQPAEGFTCVRCCGSPRASIPHGLAAKIRLFIESFLSCSCL